MARLLVVDDDRELLVLTGRWLCDAGHEAKLCDAAVDALFALAHSPYDLLLTDIVMPEMDGTELAEKAWRLQPGLKVLAVSGGGPMPVETALEIAHGYGLTRTLPKPLQGDALLAAIDDLLQLD